MFILETMRLTKRLASRARARLSSPNAASPVGKWPAGLDEDEVLKEVLAGLPSLPRLAPIALAEAERTFELGGPIAAAQRLWSLMLAAADGRAYSDLIRDHPREEAYIRATVAQLRNYIVNNVTATSRINIEFPPKRFLLCLDFLPPSNRYGSHMHQVCCYAAALATLPRTESLLIMATGESMPERNVLSECYLDFRGNYAEAWNAALERVAEPEIISKISLYDPLSDRVFPTITKTVEVAERFKPHTILYFQGWLRSSLLPQILKDIAPQIAVQFNIHNQEPEFCDLVLSHGRAINFETKPTPELWTSHIVPIVPLASENEGELPQALPVGPTRIVTALSLGRIEGALLADPTLAAAISSFLKANPEAAWIFIGVLSPDEILSRYPDWRQLVETGRILLMGHTLRLREVFAECTLYLHPPGFGGGAMGVAMAIAERLPVLVEAGTDSANFIGDEATFRTREEAFDLLNTLKDNPIEQRRLATSQAEMLEARHSISTVAQRLQEILPLAHEHFQLRQRAY